MASIGQRASTKKAADSSYLCCDSSVHAFLIADCWFFGSAKSRA